MWTMITTESSTFSTLTGIAILIMTMTCTPSTGLFTVMMGQTTSIRILTEMAWKTVLIGTTITTAYPIFTTPTMEIVEFLITMQPIPLAAHTIQLTMEALLTEATTDNFTEQTPPTIGTWCSNTIRLLKSFLTTTDTMQQRLL